MALSAQERSQLPPTDFVFPDSRRYPIPDREHAVLAEHDSRGKPERGAVCTAIRQRYGILCADSL